MIGPSPIRLLTLFCFFTILRPTLSSQEILFDRSEIQKEVYNDLLDLNLKDGKTLLHEYRNTGPLEYLLEDYCFLLPAFFEETNSLYGEFQSQNTEHMEAVRLLEEPSAEKEFVLAELLLHSAICKAKFGEYFSSFFEIRKAYRKFERNIEQYPEFLPNYKSIGMLQVLLSTAPDNLKWGLRLFSLDSDVDQGLQNINYFLNNSESDALFVKETIAAKLYILYHIMNDVQGTKDWMNNKMQDNDNLLFAFLKGNVLFKLGETDEAITIIDQSPKGVRYIEFTYLEYLLGKMKLTKLDLSAEHHFLNYLSSFKGRNYIKASYQKLSWIALLAGNEEQYHIYSEQCVRKGANEIGEDKRAYRDAIAGKIPNIQLLKAQLQFDGGYYNSSIELLNEIESSSLRDEELIDYHYRYGRTYCESNKPSKAIKHLTKTIELQGDKNYYYGPKAAIESGKIYEEQEFYHKAFQQYEKALTFSGHPYENSLDQEAKAGMQRVLKFL